MRSGESRLHAISLSTSMEVDARRVKRLSTCVVSCCDDAGEEQQQRKEESDEGVLRRIEESFWGYCM